MLYLLIFEYPLLFVNRYINPFTAARSRYIYIYLERAAVKVFFTLLDINKKKTEKIVAIIDQTLLFTCRTFGINCKTRNR